MGLRAGLFKTAFAAFWIILHWGLAPQAAQADTIRVAYRFARPAIERGKEHDRARVEGLMSTGRPGAPMLPHRLAKILLPPGSRVTRVDLLPAKRVALAGTYRIAPAARAHSPASGEAPRGPRADPKIYGSSTPYPRSPLRFLGTGVKHGRRIALVDLFPVSYAPAEGRLTYVESLVLEVTVVSETAGARTPARASGDLEGWVDNPPEAALAGSGGQDDDDVAYAIVTSSRLAAAFEPLASARSNGGLAARIFTMEWIRSTYDGTRPDGGADDATRVRNFIEDYYQNHGLRYALLGGDADAGADCDECEAVIVPTRYFQTDALFANAIASDMYFGCLDGTFDGDGDGLYGEPGDGEEGGDVDFLFEVHVGRAPVDSLEEAESFVAKTLAYDASAGPLLREVLFVGEYLGFGGGYDWGGNLNEQIRTGSSDYITTVGFENSVYADFFRTEKLYDRETLTGSWKPAELIASLESGIHIVNHVGHADASSVMRLSRAEIDALGGSSAFLGYTQSCYAGSFDNRTTDGGYGEDSVAEHLLTGPAGAVALIANSRRGWVGTSYADGPSQRFNRRFWDGVFRLGILQWGAANDRSREESLADIAVSERSRWCAYELNTLGDPALTLRFASRKGGISLDREWYNTGDSATVTVTDADLNESPDALDTAQVTVAAPSTGDREVVEIQETGRSSGVFQGAIELARGAASAGDGVLQLEPPDVVLASYEDLDDGTGAPASPEASSQVTAPLAVTGPCPPEGALGVPYDDVIEVEGGLPPYTFAAEEGYVEVAGDPLFEGLGVSQDWQSDEGFWTYALPFEFPFYGKLHDSVTVSSNGYIDLSPGSGLEFQNSVFGLIAARRIAVLWADLVTGGGGDVYINEKADSVTFRWRASGYHTHGVVNCEVELFEDGTIRFGYGSGNEDLSATIGISAGDGESYVVSELNGSHDLARAPAIYFRPTRLPGGLAIAEGGAGQAGGRIRGFPDEAGLHDVSIRVEDADGQVARKLCSLRIRSEGLVLFAPSAGDLWPAGEEGTVRWEWYGNAGSRVRLDYNTDGSTTAFPFSIAPDVPLADRERKWDLPDLPAETARVRIQSVEKPEYFTYSQPFSIVGPTILLRSPNGGENWVTGMETAVRWERIGNPGGRVRIAYSTDGSQVSFPHVIAAEAPDTGTFHLVVPDTPSLACRLLVEDTGDPSVRAVSAETFAIRPPSLTIVSPNGGECLRAGETTVISWLSSGDTGSRVFLDFNITGDTEGFPYAVSPDPLPNTGSAEWTVPELMVASARVRVRSWPPRYTDHSDAAFSIQPRCTTRVVIWIPYIAADEEQAVGVEQALARFGEDAEIAFSEVTTPATLQAELEGKDAIIVVKQKQGGGVDFHALGEALAPVFAGFLARGGALVFCAQVPDSEPLLQATGLADVVFGDEGVRLCEVARPEDPMMAGIRPVFPGPVRTASFHCDGSVFKALVTTGEEGEAVVASRTYGFGRLAVLGFDYYSSNDMTSRILAHAVEVDAPRDGIRLLEPPPGAAFLVGETLRIRWIARGGAQGPVSLSYNTTGSDSSFPLAIGEAAPQDEVGSYDWVAPPLPPQSPHLSVRIEARSIAAPQHRDVLEGVIHVVEPLVVETETLPSGSVGLAYVAPVRWKGGIAPYDLVLRGLPAGLTYRGVDDRSLEIVGAPQMECEDCEIELDIRDATGQSASARFPLPVLVRGLELLRPRGGELWLYGTEQQISWTVRGEVGETVSLRYNTDGSLIDFPLVIAESAPIGDAFTWHLPVIDAPTCRLKVQSNEFPQFYAVDAEVFSIVGPSIRIDTPNGGECWEPGREKTILWRSASSGGETVRIEYNTDGSPDDFPYLLAEAAPDTGEYPWIVDAPPSETCRVRVSFTQVPQISNVSAEPFRVGPGCRLRGLLWSPFFSLLPTRLVMIGDILEQEPDFESDSLRTDDPEVLSAALRNKDVIIVLLMHAGSRQACEALGVATRTVLTEFVEAGGVVVFCGPDPDGVSFLEAAALASEASVASTGRLACRAASYLHPIASGAPLEFWSPSSTSAYVLEGGPWETVFTCPEGPVVAARDQGLGRWVIVGFPYAGREPVGGRILANAVRMRPVLPGLRVLSPAPGSVFFSGEPVSVEWAARGVEAGPVKIAYNTDGSESEFPLQAGEAEGGEAGGQFVWTAPVPESGDHFPCRIEVRRAGEPSLPAHSEEVFHVVKEPLSIVTEQLPGGRQNAQYDAEIRAAGGVLPYAFYISGLHAGIISIAPEPGQPASRITGVPVETGTDRTVRVTVEDALGLRVERSLSLDVLPSQIEILSPLAGEYLLAGSTCEIRWKVHGNAGEMFRIEYNLNGSPRDFPYLVSGSVPAGSGFSWVLPEAESTSVRLQISSETFPGLSAVSEGDFAILKPGVTCLHPNGGEQLKAGVTRTIRWRSLGNPGGTVRISLNTTGSTTEFPLEIAAAAPDTGEYSWSVPGSVSDACRIRLQFTDAPDLKDASDAVFSICHRVRTRGLVWIPHTGFEDAEVRGAIAAITLHDHDFDWVLSKAVTAPALESQMYGMQTFIMVQQRAAEANFKALGRSLGPALKRFVTRGGCVVVLKQLGSAADFLAAAGLFQATQVGSAWNAPCRVAWPEHPINHGVPEEFQPNAATAWYTTEEGADVDVYATNLDGLPVVLGRDLGDGRVVIVGFDYSDYSESSGRILANALRNTRAGEQPLFVRGDANSDGKVDLGDAIFILNYLYRGGPEPHCLDAADVDDSAEREQARSPIEINDSMILLQWLFRGGSPPAPPSPSGIRAVPGSCGTDPQLWDGLDCAWYPPCLE